MLRFAVFTLASSFLILASGCSDNNPGDADPVQVTKSVAESGEVAGQSSLTIAVDPQTGTLVPGGAVASVVVQADEESAPEYRVTDSPVSGGLLQSSAGFATPLTAKIGCDGKWVMGHGDLSLSGGADCQPGKGE